MDQNKFIEGEKEIRRKYHLLLLVELIKYYYDNKVEIKVNNILNSLQDMVVYNDNEKEKLINDASNYLLEKYNIKI